MMHGRDYCARFQEVNFNTFTARKSTQQHFPKE